MKLEAKITVDMRDYENDINSGKITATAAMLNQLTIYANEAAEHYKSRGSFALAKRAEKDAEKIFRALESLGFYED